MDDSYKAKNLLLPPDSLQSLPRHRERPRTPDSPQLPTVITGVMVMVIVTVIGGDGDGNCNQGGGCNGAPVMVMKVMALKVDGDGNVD